MGTMIGYHYTSWKNWLKIRREGLIPQLIKERELTRHFKEPIFGVYVWKEKNDILGNIGDIFRVLSMHEQTHIVLLKIDFSRKDILRKSYKGENISLTPFSSIGNFEYHFGGFEAYVLKNKIPISRINLIKSWNLLKLFKV